MNILSIQSSVCYGHVGNAAAVFPLQLLGAEVWPVDTVQFSNHPGYGDWTGRVGTGAEIATLLDGIERRGAFARCDAVLSGYLGDPGIVDAVLAAVGRVRAARPDALYCCDPVIGDAGRVYVRDGIPQALADRAMPAADILTPNQFELERLAGITCPDRDATRRAIAAVRARMHGGGPRVVLLTSVSLSDTPPDALDIVAADANGAFAVRVPRLHVAASGAGDLMAALFLFHFLRHRHAATAAAAAAAAAHAILQATEAAGATDLRLVAARDQLVAPAESFATEEF